MKASAFLLRSFANFFVTGCSEMIRLFSLQSKHRNYGFYLTLYLDLYENLLNLYFWYLCISQNSQIIEDMKEKKSIYYTIRFLGIQ